MELRFGGEAVLPLGQRELSLSRRTAPVPLFLTPWRIGGLVSLHVQGRREEMSPWKRMGTEAETTS
jgi:hypothetical protein